MERKEKRLLIKILRNISNHLNTDTQDSDFIRELISEFERTLFEHDIISVSIYAIKSEYTIGDDYKRYKNKNKHIFYPYTIDENECYEIRIFPKWKSASEVIITNECWLGGTMRTLTGEFEEVSGWKDGIDPYKRFKTKLNINDFYNFKIEVI